MSSFKLNDSLKTQQLVDVMNNVNQLVNYLQDSGVSIDVNSSNENGDSAEANDSVEAQQDETAALTITLETPLGTITFSVSLDLPLEEVLNVLLQLITTVVCALFPDLNICSSEGASSQTEDNGETN